MQIKSVAARNIKGVDFEHQLAPVTVFTGDNFSHKTAVLDAIKIALLGYHPRLGKTNQLTWKLAGGKDELYTCLTVADGRNIKREWKRDSKGSIKILEQVPGDLITPTELLDTATYFSKTGPERVTYVFDRIKLEKFEDVSLVVPLTSIEVLPSVVCAPVIKELAEMIKVTIGDRDRENQNTQVWISKLIERIDKEKKAAEGAAKVAAASATAIKSSTPEKATDPSGELKLAETKYQMLYEKHSKLTSLRDQAQKNEARIAELLQMLKDTDEYTDNDRQPLLTQIETVGKELAAYTCTLPTKAKAYNTARENFASLQARVDRTKSEASDMRARIEATKQETCPKCQHEFDGPLRTSILEQLTKTEAMIPEMEKELAALTEAGQKLKVEHEEAKAAEAAINIKRVEHSQASAKLMRIDGTIKGRKQIQSEIDNLRSQAPPEELAGMKQLENDLNAVYTSVTALQAQLVKFQSYVRAINQRDTVEAESVKAQVRAEVFKKALLTVREIQGKMVSEAFNGLLSKARLFTDDILLSPLAYAGGDLGRREGDTWVSYETFSGTEELLAFAGLSVALCQTAPIKIVMMDELGRLTDVNKAKLLDRMLALTASNEIDNFIGIDADATFWENFKRSEIFSHIKL